MGREEIFQLATETSNQPGNYTFDGMADRKYEERSSGRSSIGMELRIREQLSGEQQRHL